VSAEPPLQVIRTGRTEPPPDVRALRAGPVRVLYSDGDLRQICHGDIELARRIYVAVRDLDWNTLPGVIGDVDITDRGDSFAIRFSRRHIAGGLDYEWHAEIDGSADGTIRYRMHGAARSAFPYAKIGICVHHPVVGYAGQPYRGSTPDGPVTGHLPDAIGPQIHLDDGTDLPLFEPVSELDIGHASGGVVKFRFSGDLWEMEDQRNWTDASYKSVSTPARLGYRHEAAAGKLLDQEVVIRAAGFRQPGGRGKAADSPLAVTVVSAGGPAFPPVGLRCASPGRVPSPAGLAVLRAIAPAHLRADVRLAADSAEAEVAAAADRARELGCGLELAVFLPGRDDPGGTDAALGRLRGSLAAASPTLARVLAFSEAEDSSSAETVTAVRGALASAGLARLPVISGTNVYFNELNRHRIPPGPADGLAWSANPQVHAFDDLSLMENLQAQPDTIVTARSFAPSTRCYVTPVTLRPRFNAVAATGQEFPESGLPRQADVRQPSLFAAAWTLGSIAALAGAGADGLTYYDTQGPAGVVEGPDRSPDPAEFFSRPDTPFPLAVVLADACGLAGRRIRALDGLDAALLAGVAIAGGGGGRSVTVLLANISAATRLVRVRAPGSSRARARLLDEESFAVATGDLMSFLASRTDIPVTEGAVTVTLHPYASTRLDLSAG
jgi:D-apionolactonase